MVPPPTRQLARRLTVTYAGVSLLERLYKRGISGQQIAPDLYVNGGLLMYWSRAFTAPWQTEAWREQMREQRRPNAFLRLVENKWISTENDFLPRKLWDHCIDPAARPVLGDRRLAIWAGVDASVKRDSTAIAACAFNRAIKKVRLVLHKIFQPSPEEPLDFENTIEVTIEKLHRTFHVCECRFDRAKCRPRRNDCWRRAFRWWNFRRRQAT
jgi:hypothetical protein